MNRVLQFDYQMQIHYTSPVQRCYYTLKCIPKESARQKLRSLQVEMEPSSVWSYGRDGWNNPKLYGMIREPHALFRVRVQGKVEILPLPYEEQPGADPQALGMYRCAFGRCIPGDGLRAYFDALKPVICGDALEKSLAIMEDLHRRFRYVSNTTSAETTAEEAWQLGTGVCQDYAHIFIALLRLFGIPARYVCGLLIGEGASHAWVEIAHGGQWIGLDPTNNCRVMENHIKLGDGRDAGECAINRGILLGKACQRQEVSVVVKALE